MRRQFCGVIAAVVGIGFASVASAADMPVKAPAYQAISYNWTGFYVGAHAGYGWGDYLIDNLGAGPTYTFNHRGFIGGGQIGYNYQAGNIVWGLEVDGSYKDLHGDDGGFFGSVDAIRSRWGGTARGRVGVAVKGPLLVYATGGVAWLNYRYSSTSPAVSWNNTDIGWVVGGGAEYAFDMRWSTKVEYRYSRFETTDRNVLNSLPWKTRPTENEILIGINYKLNP